MAMQQSLIRNMRVGSKLIFGKYSCNKDAVPEPITWLKASQSNHFIAECALDYICFDARELRENPTIYSRYGSGNSDYALSNIHTFLNSEDYEWYIQRHPRDTAPVAETTGGFGGTGRYADHPGFLNHFEDFEIGMLEVEDFNVNGNVIQTRVRLPLYSEIAGNDRFMLFHRKGVRAHPTSDFCLHKGIWTDFNSETQWVPYVLADKHHLHTQCVWEMNRSGYMYYAYPEYQRGIRPVIKLDPCAKVEEVEKGVFEPVLGASHKINVCSDGDFLSLLGLV